MTEARRAFLLDELQRIKRLAEQDGAILIAGNIGQLWQMMRDCDEAGASGPQEMVVKLEATEGWTQRMTGPAGSRVTIEFRAASNR